MSVLNGQPATRPPVWLMRQAGRHLPEYLKLRTEARDFLDFCYTPEMAAEATVQPIRRYGMDAAILFADILLILDAMGRNVRFVKGEGPVLDPIDGAGDLTGITFQDISQHLSPVYETVRRVKSELGTATPLIGFCGSPWTVALYAIEGRGKTDRSKCKLWAYERAGELASVLENLAEASAHYLAGQARAGVDALMLFDSWADGLADDVFRQIIIRPTRSLMQHLRALDVTLPVIGFPRGAGAMLGEYVRETGVQAVGLDTAAVPAYVNDSLPAGFPVQGQLDPLLLRAGGAPMEARIRALMNIYSDRPHIFNLGHGVTPDVPIGHVERLLEIVREQAPA